jgi:hypothetical protein
MNSCAIFPLLNPAGPNSGLSLDSQAPLASSLAGSESTDRKMTENCKGSDRMRISGKGSFVESFYAIVSGERGKFGGVLGIYTSFYLLAFRYLYPTFS